MVNDDKSFGYDKLFYNNVMTEFIDKEIEEIRGTISNEHYCELGYDKDGENPHTHNILMLLSQITILKSIKRLIPNVIDACMADSKAKDSISTSAYTDFQKRSSITINYPAGVGNIYISDTAGNSSVSKFTADSNLSLKAEILWALSEFFGFEPSELFDPDSEDFRFETNEEMQSKIHADDIEPAPQIPPKNIVVHRTEGRDTSPSGDFEVYGEDC